MNKKENATYQQNKNRERCGRCVHRGECVKGYPSVYHRCSVTGMIVYDMKKICESFEEAEIRPYQKRACGARYARVKGDHNKDGYTSIIVNCPKGVDAQDMENITITNIRRTEYGNYFGDARFTLKEKEK